MFDVSWSELLILGLVTLIFVGPKELPRFLGQLGRYMGVVRRQANEFRAVFEQAMREAEFDQINKDIKAASDGLKSSVDDVKRSVVGGSAPMTAAVPAKPSADGAAPIEVRHVEAEVAPVAEGKMGTGAGAEPPASSEPHTPVNTPVASSEAPSQEGSSQERPSQEGRV